MAVKINTFATTRPLMLQVIVNMRPPRLGHSKTQCLFCFIFGIICSIPLRSGDGQTANVSVFTMNSCSVLLPLLFLRALVTDMEDLVHPAYQRDIEKTFTMLVKTDAPSTHTLKTQCFFKVQDHYLNSVAEWRRPCAQNINFYNGSFNSMGDLCETINFYNDLSIEKRSCFSIVF